MECMHDINMMWMIYVYYYEATETTGNLGGDRA